MYTSNAVLLLLSEFLWVSRDQDMTLLSQQMMKLFGISALGAPISSEKKEGHIWLPSCDKLNDDKEAMWALFYWWRPELHSDWLVKIIVRWL